jgi:N-acetylmuramoyl-L-alanine amidase
MPSIKWIGSPNYHKGRGGYKVLAIVNHVMCGTLAGTDAWFNDPKSQVSTHYGIGKDGSIHQYVKDEDTAWAVGLTDKPISPLIRQYPGLNPNYYTISIEYEGYPQDGLTEAQYQSALWLHKQLIQKFGIPVDETHITGHFAFDTVSRSDCPGPKFPWDRLYKDLGGHVPVEILHVGSVGAQVKEVQQAINKLGYTPVLKEDGIFGPNTEKAVEWFQHLMNIHVDGEVGPETWDHLFPQQKPPAPAPEPPKQPAPPKAPEPAPQPAPEPPKAPEPAPAPARKLLQIVIDLETGKVISTEEVSK